MTEAIRNRVEDKVRSVRAGDLIPNAKNWRKHPKAQRDALLGVLHDIGYISPLIARETPAGLELIDGHLRAETTPDDLVPVAVVDLNDAEVAEALATLDPLAAMATANTEALDALLRDVTTTDAALMEMLAQLAEDSGLDYGKPEPVEDPGADVDRAEELREKWQTERGQLWEIRHKFVCPKCGGLT